MNVNLTLTMNYINIIPLAGQKNKPKQTQTNPIKACPERSEFTLSVIEGNGPIFPVDLHTNAV